MKKSKYQCSRYPAFEKTEEGLLIHAPHFYFVNYDSKAQAKNSMRYIYKWIFCFGYVHLRKWRPTEEAKRMFELEGKK